MKSIVIILGLIVVLLGVIFIGKDAVSPPDTAQTSAVSGGDVVYYQNVKGYLSLPDDSSAQQRAVILIHEWWGLNDDIKSLADRFAKEGYIALAVDLYNGKVATTPDDARNFAGAVRENTEEAFANLSAAVAYLQSREDVDKELLASVGWCFGGGWSYNMAVNNLGTKASVMYYGQFDPEDDFAHMKASILGHFGEKDTAIAVDSVKEFQAKLMTDKGMHQVYIYPNAGHGFANERGGQNTAYDKEAAELAWGRTMEFLDTVFRE